MRPPGGFALHMHNMSNNTDCFRAYADMVTGALVEEESADEKYYTLFWAAIMHYAHSEEEPKPAGRRSKRSLPPRPKRRSCPISSIFSKPTI